MNTTTTPEFISVGALGEGFAVNNNILDANDGLNGYGLTLNFPGGRTHECRILNSHTVVWDGQEQDARVTSVRDGIYFVDFLKGEDFLVGASVKKSVSLVLDNNSGQVTLVEGTLPDEQSTSISAYDRARQGMELTGVEAAIHHGSVGGAQGGAAHAPTDELIGLRNRYHYSPEEVYEHVYLNNNFYTWHCIKGSEAGLGDTDRCHYIKIAEGLYLFVWREKIVPTLGVILIDMNRLKTDGKIFGYNGFDFSSYTNFPVGAITEVVNLTTH